MDLRETEYDPFTGITKRWYFDGDKIICHKSYEEGDHLDMVAIERSMTAGSSFIGDSRCMHKMASLPPIVIEKILKEHNLDIMGDMSPADTKKLYKIIELEYPWCKTHEKKLWRPAYLREAAGEPNGTE